MRISAFWRRALARLAAAGQRSAVHVSLDRRTLADIGIGPGPVLFVADRVGRDRLRPHTAHYNGNTIAPWWTSSRHSSA